MAKEKIELTDFGGIDNSISSEDSSTHNAIYSHNIDTLIQGELNATGACNLTNLAWYRASSSGQDYQGVTLLMDTLNNGDKTDIITVHGGDPNNDSITDGQIHIDALEDVYRFFDTPEDWVYNDEDGKINLMGEEDGGLLFNNLADSVLRTDKSVESGTVTSEKWNNSMHIGLGDSEETTSMWVGRVKGGFLQKNDSRYNQLACKPSSVETLQNTSFSKVVTDCFNPIEMTDNTEATLVTTRTYSIGKFAFGFNYGGNYVYKYDLDPAGQGQSMENAVLVKKSEKFRNLVAITYDMNGELANKSFSPNSDESIVRVSDGLVIVIDSGDSGIGQFGGEIILMRAHDLEIIKRYTIKYPEIRKYDQGMTAEYLGLDKNSETSQWYQNTRGDGIGDMIISNSMEHIEDETDANGNIVTGNGYPTRTLWISISGNHRIGLARTDGTSDYEHTNSKYSRASFRVLWRTPDNFFTYGWPDADEIEMVNASPPCLGYKIEDGSTSYGLSGHLRTPGWWQIPKNALSLAEGGKWISLAAIGIKGSNAWGQEDSGILNSDGTLKKWEWGSPCPDETAQLQPASDDVLKMYNPLEITGLATTNADNEYQFARICALYFHHTRNLNDAMLGRDYKHLSQPTLKSLLFKQDDLIGVGENASTNSLLHTTSDSFGNTFGYARDVTNTTDMASAFRTASATYTTQDDNNPDGSAGARTRSTCGIEMLLHESSSVQDGGETADFHPLDILYSGSGFIADPGNNVYSSPIIQYETFAKYNDASGVPGQSTLTRNNHRNIIIRSNNKQDFNATQHNFDSQDPENIRIEPDGATPDNVIRADVSNRSVNYSNWGDAQFVPRRLVNESEHTGTTYEGQDFTLYKRDYPNENYDGDDTIEYDPIPTLDSDDAIDWSGLLQILFYSKSKGNLMSGFLASEQDTNADVVYDNYLKLEGLEDVKFHPTYETGAGENKFPDVIIYKSILNDIDNGFLTLDDAGQSGTLSNLSNYNYYLTYLLDGFQESPLGDSFVFEPQDDNAAVSIKVSLRCVDEEFILENTRITGVNIYRQAISKSQGTSNLSEIALGKAELVKSLSLSPALWQSTVAVADYETSYYREYTFIDSGKPGVSYSALNDIPETLSSSGLNYSLSTQIGSYHFVGRCYVKESNDHVPNGIFRSKPAKFDVFDWSNDYILLPENPTAIQGFQGRLYAFSDSNTYVIDPNTLQILDKYEGSGCFGPNSVAISDEHGMLFANKRGIYLNNGGSVLSVGLPINSSANNIDAEDTYEGQFNFSKSGSRLLFSDRYAIPKIYYLGSKESFIISCHVPYGNNQAHPQLVTKNDKVFIFTPKYSRWEIYRQPILTAVNGSRNDLLFINGTNKADWFGGSEVTSDYRGGYIGQFNESTSLKNGLWRSHRMTMGAPTQDKILSKLRISSTDTSTLSEILNYSGTNTDLYYPVHNIDLKTDKTEMQAARLDLQYLEGESNSNMLVYKIKFNSQDFNAYSQSFIKKVKWVQLELSFSGKIDAVSITFRRRNMT